MTYKYSSRLLQWFIIPDYDYRLMSCALLLLCHRRDLIRLPEDQIGFSTCLIGLTSELDCLCVDDKVWEFSCQSNLLCFTTFIVHVAGTWHRWHTWHYVFTRNWRHRPSLDRRIVAPELTRGIKTAKLDSRFESKQQNYSYVLNKNSKTRCLHIESKPQTRLIRLF